MNVHGIDLDSPAIRDFRRKWKVRELSVFGSILRDDFRPDSDVDLLIDFDPEAEWDLFDHLAMEEELTEIVGRHVDLLTRYSVESSENPYYRRQILSTAEPISAER